MNKKAFPWDKLKPASRADSSGVLVVSNVKVRMEAQHFTLSMYPWLLTRKVYLIYSGFSIAFCRTAQRYVKLFCSCLDQPSLGLRILTCNREASHLETSFCSFLECSTGRRVILELPSVLFWSVLQGGESSWNFLLSFSGVLYSETSHLGTSFCSFLECSTGRRVILELPSVLFWSVSQGGESSWNFLLSFSGVLYREASHLETSFPITYYQKIY
jgi:hypothetical protein